MNTENKYNYADTTNEKAHIVAQQDSWINIEYENGNRCRFQFNTYITYGKKRFYYGQYMGLEIDDSLSLFNLKYNTTFRVVNDAIL